MRNLLLLPSNSTRMRCLMSFAVTWSPWPWLSLLWR